MESNREIAMIRRMAGNFARHPTQVNDLMEADAEIIPFHGEYLVVKTDCIHEEIQLQLYTDPYLIGWMSVIAPVSDIAAVGATPIGVLLSVLLPNNSGENWEKEFQRGIKDACSECEIFVLGGDTSFASMVSISTTAVAGIKSGNPLMRSGLKPGDRLYTTSRLGVGNAFAYACFFDKSLEVSFRPMARLHESKTIRKYANACIDTSDGLFPALSVLSEINQVGICIDTPLIQLLSEEAIFVHHQAEVQDWILLAGPHGEYELLFTIPEQYERAFLENCHTDQWTPVYLGQIIEEPHLSFQIESVPVKCHPAIIANLYVEAEGNIAYYFELLMQQHTRWTTPT